MKSVRQKWASHKTYRKIQKTWQDYTAVSEKSHDVQTVAQRLTIFLDTFDEAYREMIPQAELEESEISVERIYGDCSEIMTTLFSAVEKESSLKKNERSDCMQEPVNKALVLMSLILKEEKYRRQVAEAPGFISRILALLEKSNSAETKVLFLRIIATIGENDRNKIEIAKSEGYKKILRLLITENQELTQEVVRTVNHLLEFNNDHPDLSDLTLTTSGLQPLMHKPSMATQTKSIPVLGFNPKSILSRSSLQLSQPQAVMQSSLPPRPKSMILNRYLPRGSVPFDVPRRPSSSASVKTVSSIGRVSQAISEVRGMFVQELGKIFPQLKDQDGLGILGMSADEIGDPSAHRNYIPTAEQIQFTIAYYSQLLDPTPLSAESPESSTTPEASAESPESSKPPKLPPRPKPVDTTDTLVPEESGRVEKRATLLKMASTPDLRVSERPVLETRRKSEDRISSELSRATRGAAVELAQEEELLRKSQPDNVLKEFMRTQGALRSLMSILSDGPTVEEDNAPKIPESQLPSGIRLATKIDIVETVCKVLFQNSANQEEFRTLDGYTTLLKVFDEIVVPSSSLKPAEEYSSVEPRIAGVSLRLPAVSDEDLIHTPLVSRASTMDHTRTPATNPCTKRSLLLGSLLAVFYDLVLDGSSRDMVQNTDAYHFLFRLMLQSTQLDIRQQALYTIQDLISLNGLNAVAAWRCGDVDMVIGLLRESLAIRPTEGTLFNTQWMIGHQVGLDVESPNMHDVCFSGVTYFDTFVVSEDTVALAEMVENGSPVYQYLLSLTRLLEYMAVMMIHDNVYILHELSRLLMEIELPSDSSIVINMILRSVGRIMSDLVARGLTVEENYTSIYLQIMRRMLDNRRPMNSPNQYHQDELEQELRDCVHTEQRLLVLHILGLVLRGTNDSIHVFDMLQGFEALTNTILPEKRSCHHFEGSSRKEAKGYAESLSDPNLCQDCFRADIVVSDLCLWLFRELSLQDDNDISVIPWVITLLKSTLSGIEELRLQSEANKTSNRYNTFLNVQPEFHQDQAHALLAYLYTKVCGTVSLIFRKSSTSKLEFGEVCGMQILLSVLSSAQHPDIATAALVAIGDFFAGYEGTKALLGDSFGYDGFLEIVLDSCRPLDKVCCEIVLEVATVGNVMSTKSRPHVESDSSIYCTEVWPFIEGLSQQHTLFHAALPFHSPRKVGERNSFRAMDPAALSHRSDRSIGSSIYPTNGRGTPSRPSSVYLEETVDMSGSGSSNIQPLIQGSAVSTLSASSGNTGVTPSSNNRYSIFGISPWSNNTTPSISVSAAQDPVDNFTTAPHFMDSLEPTGTGSLRFEGAHSPRSGRSTPAPMLDTFEADSLLFKPSSPTGVKPVQPSKGASGVANRKRSNSRNLGGFGLNTTNLGFHNVVHSERMAFKQLAGIVFRDADAARMTLRLLGRITGCNNPKLATDYFNLLMLLMEVTPMNKELLGRNDGLHYMLQILFGRGRQHDGLGITSSGYPYLPRTSDPPYVDLLPAIGAYDISVEDIRLLFDAVCDPLGVYFKLASDSIGGMPLSNTIKDSLGPLPELPSNFDADTASKRGLAGRPRSESAGAFTLYSSRRKGSRHHNPTPGSLIGHQANPMFIGEMEQQMMYAIEKISERVDPPAYFNFNGINASLTTYPGVVEKVVAAKGGYTISVWAKVTAFLEKETGLFCYEEENGNRTTFELYFKSLDQSNRYCLCVRTQHYPSPAEDFVFDRFDFAETGIWHHIVFVHHKTMKLIVDGCVIQSYGTFNQRRQEKESAMVGVFGRKGRHSMSSTTTPLPTHDSQGHSNSYLGTTYTASSSSPSAMSSSATFPGQSYGSSTNNEPTLGYFCGQVGKVHFLQGKWDQETAERVYNLGPASTESWKTLDIKSPVIAILDPVDFKRDMELITLDDVGSARAGEASTLHQGDLSLTHGILQGGTTIHMTNSMRNLIGQVGGMRLCFRFLELSPSHLQLVGLRVISNLLYKSPENIAQFQTELNGFEVIYEHLASSASELSVDHFGVLFDIAINGMIKDEHLILSNTPCVQLILRLLPSTVDSVQSFILRTLVDLIVESPENMRFWRASFGMTTLFELFKTLPIHLRPFLMWTLELMMDGMSVQELGLLIGFAGHEDPSMFEIRREIIEMIFKRMTSDHSIVDLLGFGLEGVTVLIGLLDSPNEHFRILILKMIGILLSDNTKSGKAALDKPNIGIGLIRSTLEKYELSMDVIQVLLGLAQNSYRCDPNFRSFEKSSTAATTRKHGEDSNALESSVATPMTPASLPTETPVLPLPADQPTNQHDSEERLSTEEIPPSGLNIQSTEPVFSESPGPRKHVYSNSVNAPFIKMSSLPADSLIISSTSSATSAPPAPSAPSAPSGTAGKQQAGRGRAKITDELTYASMIRLILELTGSLPHTDLVTHTLTDLKRLMTAENMRILWEAGWVNWVGAFIRDKTLVRVTSAVENLCYNRTMGVLDGMMQKMMIFDLSRKGSFTARNKGTLVSSDGDVVVQLRLTEAALAWFDKNPNLDTDAAPAICKGLVLLFRRLEVLTRNFEEDQKKAEKIRIQAAERARAQQEERRRQQQERDRLAFEAVSSALNGMLSGMSDEFDAKSVLFKPEEGDTDAEEVIMEHVEDRSSESDVEDESCDDIGVNVIGTVSPVSSPLSLPLPILSSHQDAQLETLVRDQSKQRSSNESTPPTSPRHTSASPATQNQLSNHRRRQQHQLHSRSPTSLSSTQSSPATPPTQSEHHRDNQANGSFVQNPESAMNGSDPGLIWPPLGLYEHFANCINSLACFNNSAIRSAMKSSGLFKIRDSLIETLGNISGPNSGGGGGGLGRVYGVNGLGVSSPYPHSSSTSLFSYQPQQPRPNNLGLHGLIGTSQSSFNYGPTLSSSSLNQHEVEVNAHPSIHFNHSDNNSNPYHHSHHSHHVRPSNDSSNTIHDLQSGKDSRPLQSNEGTNLMDGNAGFQQSGGNRSRKRPSQRPVKGSGLGLGMPNVIFDHA